MEAAAAIIGLLFVLFVLAGVFVTVKAVKATKRGVDRTVAHARRTGALRPGLTLIGDKGFAGREFEDLLTAGFGLHLVRPDRRDEAPRHRPIGWIRQWIESVNDTLKGQPGPGTPRRPHHRRRPRAYRPAAAGHGRHHLAQPGNCPANQAIADRLRPLNP